MHKPTPIREGMGSFVRNSESLWAAVKSFRAVSSPRLDSAQRGIKSEING